MSARGNWAYQHSFPDSDGQGGGRHDRWRHRAPRRDRVSSHDRELIDVMLARPRTITDNCRDHKGQTVPRDRCEKFRGQSDDVLSRTPGNLNEPGRRHRDGKAVTPRSDQREFSRQQECGQDIAGRWGPLDGAAALRAR